MSEMKLPENINFNTLIGTIALAVIIWVGSKTASNSDSLTKIETQLPYVNASVIKLESQITQLVTPLQAAALPVQQRLAAIAAEHAKVSAAAAALQFAMLGKIAQVNAATTIAAVNAV
jgi:hypothetical protein